MRARAFPWAVAAATSVAWLACGPAGTALEPPPSAAPPAHLVAASVDPQSPVTAGEVEAAGSRSQEAAGRGPREDTAPPGMATAEPDAGREAAPPASAASAAPRLTSQGYVTWIRRTPESSDRFLGYVRVGQSVALRSEELVRGPGCPGGFYAVEPRGFVCNDRTVTLTPAARFLETSLATAPRPGPFPYRYALSNGAPMYNRVPSAAEQGRFERPFGRAGDFKPLIRSLAAHEELAVDEPIDADGPLLAFLAGQTPVKDGRLGLVRQTIPLGSMLSFTRAFEAAGRTWLLSADLTLVPADRVRPFRPTAFRGTPLGRGVTLPIAWIRRAPADMYAKREDGGFRPARGAWPIRSFVSLTGERVEHEGVTRLRTRTALSADDGGGAAFLTEEDATVVEAVTRLPAGVKPGQKWMLVSITQGTLVAYEDRTPVFATLISPGAGGVPVRGQDPVRASTTPLGTYYVTFKDRAATMSPEQGLDRAFWIADVPHTQYFNPPFALHAAYWHERFGEPTSAGCVNLSPPDAALLFDWSDPPVPEGWQGATGAGAPENGPTSAVVVRR